MEKLRVLLCASLGRAEIARALGDMPDVSLTVAPDTDAVIGALAAHDVLMCPNPVYTHRWPRRLPGPSAA